MNPLVSIIIPNYNHASYLTERIESVLNQTYQNFEIIILDDFSQDNSREVIEKYRANNKVAHIIYNQENSGSTFKQWQKGFELAKGELIWLAESDDYAEEILLESLVPMFHDNEVVVAYVRSLIVMGKKVDKPYIFGEQIHPHLWETNKVFEGKQFIKSFLQFRNVIPNASAVVFRKDKAEISPILQKMRYSGDWIFWVHLATQGKIAYVAKLLNYFRKHQETTSSIKGYEQELIRTKECFMCIDFANKALEKTPNLFEKHYTWLVEIWFSKRKYFTLKETLYLGYPPYFSFCLLTTLPVMGIDKISRMIYFLYHKIQLRTRIRRVLKK